MKTLTQCRERLDEVLNYFLERADAEYFTDRASPVPNEEMRLLTIVEEIKAFLESDRAQSDDGAVPDGIKRYDFRVIDRSFCEDSWREHAMVESTKGEYVKVKDLGAAPQQPAQGRGVPEEPTERMLEAAMSERDWQHPTNAKRYLCNVWQKMLSAAHSQQGEWVACSERLPTEDDADCSGEVWAFDSAFNEVVSEYYENLCNRPVCTHWKPTGLTRPAAPDMGGADDE